MKLRRFIKRYPLPFFLAILHFILMSCFHDPAHLKHQAHVSSKQMSQFFSGVRPSRTYIEAQYRYAIHLQRIGKHRISLEVLRDIARHDPGNPKIFNALGIAYDNLRDYNNAVIAYNEALALDPDLDYVHNNLGYSMLLQKDYEGAKKSFRVAISTAGGNSDVGKYNNNLALAHTKSGTAHETLPVAVADVTVEGAPEKVLYVIEAGQEEKAGLKTAQAVVSSDKQPAIETAPESSGPVTTPRTVTFLTGPAPLTGAEINGVPVPPPTAIKVMEADLPLDFIEAVDVPLPDEAMVPDSELVFDTSLEDEPVDIHEAGQFSAPEMLKPAAERSAQSAIVDQNALQIDISDLIMVPRAQGASSSSLTAIAFHPIPETPTVFGSFAPADEKQARSNMQQMSTRAVSGSLDLSLAKAQPVGEPFYGVGVDTMSRDHRLSIDICDLIMVPQPDRATPPVVEFATEPLPETIPLGLEFATIAEAPPLADFRHDYTAVIVKGAEFVMTEANAVQANIQEPALTPKLNIPIVETIDQIDAGADAVSGAIPVTGAEINGVPVSAPAVVEVAEGDRTVDFPDGVESDKMESVDAPLPDEAMVPDSELVFDTSPEDGPVEIHEAGKLSALEILKPAAEKSAQFPIVDQNALKIDISDLVMVPRLPIVDQNALKIDISDLIMVPRPQGASSVTAVEINPISKMPPVSGRFVPNDEKQARSNLQQMSTRAVSKRPDLSLAKVLFAWELSN